MKRLLIALLVVTPSVSEGPGREGGAPPAPPGPSLTLGVTHAPDAGCISCHAGIEPMHSSTVVKLSCTDCHGGNGTAKNKDEAHVHPRNADVWKTSANPPRSYTALLRESP